MSKPKKRETPVAAATNCSACGGSGLGKPMYRPEIDKVQRDRCYTCKGSGKARPAGLSKYVKMPDDGCGEWIAAPDNGGDIGDLLDIAEELNGLLIALHDAIDRPKGVVPESAEKFYQPNANSAATGSQGNDHE